MKPILSFLRTFNSNTSSNINFRGHFLKLFLALFLFTVVNHSSHAQEEIAYTPFLKTSSVTEGVYEINYTYGADYQRVKSILKQNNSIIETKYYIGNYEKQISGAVTREIHYVSGGNGLCAIIVRESGVNNFYFVYSDHLGSILTVTDINGNVVAEQNFDAWGRNRNSIKWLFY